MQSWFGVPPGMRGALLGFAVRMADALPGRIVRIGLLGPRRARDGGGFPIIVVVRDLPAQGEARREVMRAVIDAGMPGLDDAFQVLLALARPEDGDARRGRTLWPVEINPEVDRRAEAVAER